MKGIKYFLKYLIFFPSVTFSILSAEIFPWAYLYSKVDGISLYKKLIPLYLLFLGSIFYSIYLTNFNISVIEVIRSIVAYLNPILIFYHIFYSKKKEEYEYLVIVKYIIISFVLFGLIQYTNLFISLESLFRNIIPRLYMQQIGGGRGVSIFSSEPSRASYEFLFLYIFIRTFNMKKYFILFDLFYFIFSFFIIKSSIGILLSLFFFIPIYKKKIPYLILFIIFLIPFIINAPLNNRAILITKTLFNNISMLNFNNAFLFLLNESGYRLISLIAAYFYGIYSFFGTGIGNWENGILEALRFLKIDPAQIAIYNQLDDSDFVSSRPTSFIASYMLDFGVFGLSVLFYSLHGLFKSIYPFVPKNLFFTFIIYIFFVGDIGNPIPWIIVALTYKLNSYTSAVNFNRSDLSL